MSQNPYHTRVVATASEPDCHDDDQRLKERIQASFIGVVLQRLAGTSSEAWRHSRFRDVIGACEWPTTLRRSQRVRLIACTVAVAMIVHLVLRGLEASSAARLTWVVPSATLLVAVLAMVLAGSYARARGES